VTFASGVDWTICVIHRPSLHTWSCEARTLSALCPVLSFLAAFLNLCLPDFLLDLHTVSAVLRCIVPICVLPLHLRLLRFLLATSVVLTSCAALPAWSCGGRRVEEASCFDLRLFDFDEFRIADLSTTGQSSIQAVGAIIRSILCNGHVGCYLAVIAVQDAIGCEQLHVLLLRRHVC
jgi:hypothetical protein